MFCNFLRITSFGFCRKSLWFHGTDTNFLAFEICRKSLVFGVDLEEMVENDEKHGCTSEEKSQTVELVVGDHVDAGSSLKWL